MRLEQQLQLTDARSIAMLEIFITPAQLRYRGVLTFLSLLFFTGNLSSRMSMFMYGLHSPEASEASITSRCSAGLSKTAKTDLSAKSYIFCSDFAAGSSNLAAKQL